MDKLEPNMYIRTKEGKIDKVLEINTEDFDEPVVRLASYPLGMYQGNFEYEKASFDLIDIIEEGDYVNGELVEYIEVDSYKDYVINSGYWCKQKDIKSIVTKEQFESMSYKVGE